MWRRTLASPKMYSDPERLGRLVSRAVNLANNEVWRRSPPPPSSLPWSTRSVAPRPPTPAHLGGALTESELASWRDEAPGRNEVQRRAFIDAAHVVRERILRDATDLPNDLAALLHMVHRRLGDQAGLGRFPSDLPKRQDPRPGRNLKTSPNGLLPLRLLRQAYLPSRGQPPSLEQKLAQPAAEGPGFVPAHPDHGMVGKAERAPVVAGTLEREGAFAP